MRPDHHGRAALVGGCAAAAFAVAGSLGGCSQPGPQGDTEPARPTTASSPTATTPSVPFDELLPLSRNELRQAVGVAVDFAAEHATYHYDEKPAGYLDRLRPMVTDEFYVALSRDAHSPGIRARRAREHLVAAAQATPVKIRVLASESLIVIAAIRQRVTTSAGSQQQSRSVAVTVVHERGTWKVHDLQPATAGNAGDRSDAGTP